MHVTYATATHALGTCPACGFVLASASVGDRNTCPDCGAHVELKWVHGGLSDYPCDHRCMYATRADCECSCGGENHGAGYLMKIHYVPAWVRTRDAKRHADKQARRQAKQDAARAAADRHREQMLDTYPLLEILLGEDYTDADPFTFLGEMRDKLQRTGHLTEAQATAACRAIERDIERAERDKQEQDKREAGVRVPTGPVEFTGTVATVRSSEFRGRLSWKMLVVTEAGWKVWLTIPKEMRRRYDTAFRSHWRSDMTLYTWPKGRTVRLQATITPSDDDPLFGFGNKPKLIAGPVRMELDHDELPDRGE